MRLRRHQSDGKTALKKAPPQRFQLHIDCVHCGKRNSITLRPNRPILNRCDDCDSELLIVGPVSGHILASRLANDRDELEITVTLFR